MDSAKSYNIQLGRRLRKIREALGITQKEVAGFLGFSNYQPYGSIEKGERELKAWELSKLSNFFNVTVEYLLGIGGQQFESTEILWRARSDPEKSKQVERKFIRFCGYYELLEKKTQSSASEIFEPEDKDEAIGFEYEKAKKLAEKYWKKLDLGNTPAMVLYDVLEKKLGFKIFQFPLESAGSGASTMEPFGPSILINAEDAPWRRNFDLAHEFFHIVTWNLFDRTKIHCGYDNEEKTEYEQWADLFASTLLLPADHLEAELKKRLQGNSGNIIDCIELSRYFGVSLDAFLWRCVNLNLLKREKVKDLLDRPDVRNLNRQARKGDRELPKKFSDRYVFLAIKCLQSGLISRSKFAEVCDINISEISEFLGGYGFSEEELYDFDFTIT